MKENKAIAKSQQLEQIKSEFLLSSGQFHRHFLEQLFGMKVKQAAFLCVLKFQFKFFSRKEICAKSDTKMLAKLTTRRSLIESERRGRKIGVTLKKFFSPSRKKVYFLVIGHPNKKLNKVPIALLNFKMIFQFFTQCVFLSFKGL
jgi:hypothetical protein